MTKTEGDYKDRVFPLEGRELSYPTRFYDGSSAMGIFSVPAKIADNIFLRVPALLMPQHHYFFPVDFRQSRDQRQIIGELPRAGPRPVR